MLEIEISSKQLFKLV